MTGPGQTRPGQTRPGKTRPGKTRPGLTGFVAKDPNYAARVAASFAKQGLMATIGARLVSVEPGEVVIELPVTAAISQQHGFVHGGAVATIADSAAGYASLTLMAASVGVLTAEFKINLMAPAAGEKLVATGRIIKPGRLLTIAESRVEAESGGQRKLVALLIATMVAVEGRDGVAD